MRADHVELRFHRREALRLRIVRGELEEANSVIVGGVAARVLHEGAWGFSSTASQEPEALREALDTAFRSARAAAAAKRRKVERLAPYEPAVGRFEPQVHGPLADRSVEEKMALVRDAEARARAGADIRSATGTYRETVDRKVIVTTEGAAAEVLDVKPEFTLSATAGEGGDLVAYYDGWAVTGGWDDLFRGRDAGELADRVAAMAARLLRAKKPKGETTTAVLDPGIVGLLCHEAIGHTAEADFVSSGSVLKGKVGEKIGSELVTLVDDGQPRDGTAAGWTPVDDEGVPARRALLIEKGILKGYLHDRESAARFGHEPTGNARAWEYTDEPIIRMRNTFIEPGTSTREELIGETRRGFLLQGAASGQADANAEFMFEVREAYRIENGEVGELLRGVVLTGQAFDVLKSVDLLGKEFRFDMGTGYCGKGQPAKVDGGGPPLRCTATIGGVQEGGG